MPPSTPRFCLTGHARFTTRDFESAGQEFELAVLCWGLTDAVFDASKERFIAAAPAESEVDFQSGKSFHVVYNPWRVDLFTAGASAGMANFSTYLAHRAAAHLLNTFAAKSFRLVTR